MSCQTRNTEPLMQNVSRVFCFVIHDDGTRSVEDILELPCSIAEAPHYYDRYWGQHRVHSGPLTFEAGYTLFGEVIWPFEPYVHVSWWRKVTAA